MDYQEALAKMRELARFGINPGLQRINELMQRLGRPEQRIGTAIHIAGTNGKGSVAAMLSSIGTAAGRKTALFTSPHLVSHTERYQINGRPIEEAAFVKVAERVFSHLEAMTAAGWESPTEFETATAIALTWFAEQRTELAVIETGMGGAIDSTNVIDAKIAVITTIAFDHLDYLGRTLEEIALVKAGIIKPGATVITGAEEPALSVIAAKTQEQGGRLLALDRDIYYQPLLMADTGAFLRVGLPYTTYNRLFLPLLGRHQVRNCALAVAAAEAAGFGEEQIVKGLLRTQWPGRLEVLRRDPLIVVDGAHNTEGMTALAEALQLYWPGKRIVCLLGMLADKQRELALEPLLPLIDQAVVTPPPYASRAGDWQRLAEICRAGGVAAELAEDNREACCRALGLLRHGGFELLLACGSLYLLGPIRSSLLKTVKD